MWFTSIGKIVYDPYRPGLKKRTDWWCVIEVDSGISDYYRWWANREIMNPLGLPHVGLMPPNHSPHISIIRGEKPKPHLMHLWKKYHGKLVQFRYRHGVRQSGDTPGSDRPDHYWFIDVECEMHTQIRKEFELPYNWKSHMTIGRTHDDHKVIANRLFGIAA